MIDLFIHAYVFVPPPVFRESEGGTARRGHHRSSYIAIPEGGEREGHYRRSGTSESISSDGGQYSRHEVHNFCFFFCKWLQRKWRKKNFITGYQFLKV